MEELFIDIETYSSSDLSKCGVYKYAQSEDFEILLFGYSIDGEAVEVVDIAGGEVIPPSIIAAIKDNSVIKYAFNATFERVCLSRFLGLPACSYLSPKSWRCHMIWSAYLGLPMSLKNVGLILNIDDKKMDEGKDLIRYFCVPCKPTKINGNRTRNKYFHALDKWNIFKAYNKRDVEAEIAIHKRLVKYPIPDFVWDEYHIDQEINDRGIEVDVRFVKNAMDIGIKTAEDMLKDMQSLTGLDNPNSVSQLKNWLEDNGVYTEDLGKKTVEILTKTTNDKVKEVLSLRQKSSKSSLKKYDAMISAVCSDNRARGMFQFYGGSRTGRFSGRLIQLQNLPRNEMPDLRQARDLVKDNCLDILSMLYDDIPDTLSQLIRTAFIPHEGYKFIVADFSAIEARVIAWYAKEEWRIKAFESGADIYCESASQMFHVPVVKHGINGELRQKGKIAELALGYGGGVGALQAMGALDMGLTLEELDPLVKAWRAASPAIVNFWWRVDKAAKIAIERKTRTQTHGLFFEYRAGMLFITLPSGRTLSYAKPKLVENKFGDLSITFEGIGATKKWDRIETYGPKLVENIVQATARDILCNSMKTLRDYRICAHVHDELIIEVKNEVTVERISNLMAITPEWCKDLVLRADGYECEFYRKD